VKNFYDMVGMHTIIFKTGFTFANSLENLRKDFLSITKSQMFSLLLGLNRCIRSKSFYNIMGLFKK
jgi:hypothetical protein